MGVGGFTGEGGGGGIGLGGVLSAISNPLAGIFGSIFPGSPPQAPPPPEVVLQDISNAITGDPRFSRRTPTPTVASVAPPGATPPGGGGGLPSPPPPPRTGNRGLDIAIQLSRLAALLLGAFRPRPGAQAARRSVFNISFPGFGGFGGFPFPNFPTQQGVAMPMPSTFVPGLPGSEGGGGFGDLIGPISQIVGLFRQGNGGGGVQSFNFPSFPSMGFDLPGIDIVGQGSTCITPRTSTTRRLPSRVDVPTTDAAGNVRYTTYRNMGRPILWSGDVACARRAKKVAGRTRRRLGGR